MKKLLAFLLLLMLSGTPALADSPTFGGGGWGIQASCATITQNGVGCWDNDNYIFYIGNGSAAVAVGGTGYSANPMSAVGDVIYGGTAGAMTRLAPNTAATTKYLQQIGTGTAGQAPTWAQVSLTAGVTGTLPVANGGTNLTTCTAGNGFYCSATGVISGYTGQVVVSKSTNANLTDAEVMNTLILVTGAAELELPAASAALVGARFTVMTVGAVAVSIDPNGSQVLTLSGTALTGGNKVTNSSTSGDFIEIICDTSTTWRTINMGGVWIDGGA